MENIIEQRTESFADESMNIEKDLEPHVENLEEVIPINNVFVTNTSYVDGGSENPLASVCLALEHTILGSTNETLEMELSENEFIPNIDDVLSDKHNLHLPTSNINGNSSVTNTESKVTITRDEKPINDFTGNNILILTAFPCLFMLGRGIKNKTKLSTTVIRHMMFQFNNRIADCHRLIFILFDQLQKHAVARIMSARVKNDPTSMKTLGSLIKDPHFLSRLRHASTHPNTEYARKILKQFSSHITLASSKVPFSKQARKAAMSKLKT